MKCFLLTFFLTISLTIAQESTTQPAEPKTKLERFFSKSGSLIVKEFIDSHSLNGNSLTKITFQYIKVYEPGRTSSEIRGLKITISSSQKEASAFLDSDEVESLKRALEYIWNEKDKLQSIINYTEVVFKTQDNFKFGAYTKDKELRLFAQIDKYPYPSFFTDFGEFNTLSIVINNFIKVITTP